MPKNLTEMINDGDLDAIDRISFGHKSTESSISERAGIEELNYNPTVWDPHLRSRRFIGLSQIYTTSFNNNNPNHPVKSFKYETSTANPDKVSIILEFRDIEDAVLPVLLTYKQFEINNPTKPLPAKIIVPQTICFSEISNEADINFIGDLMYPFYLLGAKPCKYGSLYFMHEHRQTVKQFKDLDYQQPLAFALRLKSHLYQKFCCWAEKEDASRESEIDQIVVSSQSLKY